MMVAQDKENDNMLDAPLALLILMAAHVNSYLIGFGLHRLAQPSDRYVSVVSWLRPLIRTPRIDGKYEFIALGVQLSGIACLVVQMGIWMDMKGYDRIFATIALLAFPHLVQFLLRVTK